MDKVSRDSNSNNFTNLSWKSVSPYLTDAGVDFVKDIKAGLTNFFGGRSGSYEGELIQARDNAIKEMAQRAIHMGANAVVGVDVDYEVLGAANNMLMVIASGTAVVVG